MIPATDPFMAGIRPTGLQKGRGGFLRSADDAPYVTDPSGEIVKTGARKGEVKRLKYGSPSNRGREIENDAGLVKYKQRLSLVGIGMSDDLAQACKALVDLPVGSPEFNSAADSIAVEADKLTRSSLAADRGTHGHLLCELWDRRRGASLSLTAQTIEAGRVVGLDEDTQGFVLDAWDDMLDDNGLEILAVEASCVDDTWRLAGTLDRIVRTTKPLTFAKPSGEIVTIPADTVLILDIKFGKCRKAHPIQIASYAQSVPYDTEVEVRDTWPWPIDQTHALIAHGDFGDDTRPVTIELVWVDLVAGREHGGQCVVDAKAWAARDDVFSVSQIVESGDGAKRIPGVIPAPPDSTLSPDDCNPHGIPRSSAGAPVQTAPLTAGEGEGAAMPPSSASTQGADLSAPEFELLWAKVRHEFEALPDQQRQWIAQLSTQARQRGVTFHTREVQTERSYHLCKALVTLAAGGADYEILEVLMEQVDTKTRLDYKTYGQWVGSLNCMQAERLAALSDEWASSPVPA